MWGVRTLIPKDLVLVIGINMYMLYNFGLREKSTNFVILFIGWYDVPSVLGWNCELSLFSMWTLSLFYVTSI